MSWLDRGGGGGGGARGYLGSVWRPIHRCDFLGELEVAAHVVPGRVGTGNRLTWMDAHQFVLAENGSGAAVMRILLEYSDAVARCHRVAVMVHRAVIFRVGVVAILAVVARERRADRRQGDFGSRVRLRVVRGRSVGSVPIRNRVDGHWALVMGRFPPSRNDDIRTPRALLSRSTCSLLRRCARLPLRGTRCWVGKARGLRGLLGRGVSEIDGSLGSLRWSRCGPRVRRRHGDDAASIGWLLQLWYGIEGVRADRHGVGRNGIEWDVGWCVKGLAGCIRIRKTYRY